MVPSSLSCAGVVNLPVSNVVGASFEVVGASFDVLGASFEVVGASFGSGLDRPVVSETVEESDFFNYF